VPCHPTDCVVHRVLHATETCTRDVYDWRNWRKQPVRTANWRINTSRLTKPRYIAPVFIHPINTFRWQWIMETKRFNETFLLWAMPMACACCSQGEASLIDKLSSHTYLIFFTWCLLGDFTFHRWLKHLAENFKCHIKHEISIQPLNCGVTLVQIKIILFPFFILLGYTWTIALMPTWNAGD
jgi:hypothetical protein